MPHFYGNIHSTQRKNLMDCSKTTCVSTRERRCFNYAPTCAWGGGWGCGVYIFRFRSLELKLQVWAINFS